MTLRVMVSRLRSLILLFLRFLLEGLHKLFKKPRFLVSLKQISGLFTKIVQS